MEPGNLRKIGITGENNWVIPGSGPGPDKNWRKNSKKFFAQNRQKQTQKEFSGSSPGFAQPYFEYDFISE